MTTLIKSLFVALVVAVIPAATASAANVTVSPGNVTAPEGAGDAAFTITTDSVLPDAPPTFNVTMLDGTAVSPADYGAPVPNGGGGCGGPDGTPCSISHPYLVPIVNDNIDEPDETFAADVSWLGPGGSVFVTIKDDDPTPVASVNDKTVLEAAGVATFTISLTNPSSGAIDVPWSTAPGSAASPADFTASSAPAHFAPGETTKDITVPIVDDNITEPQENYLVNL